MVLARSFFARRMGIAATDRIICGRKASDSTRKLEVPGCMELRWRRVL